MSKHLWEDKVGFLKKTLCTVGKLVAVPLLMQGMVFVFVGSRDAAGDSAEHSGGQVRNGT